jgi:hypothetical protein
LIFNETKQYIAQKPKIRQAILTLAGGGGGGQNFYPHPHPPPELSVCPKNKKNSRNV